MDTFRQAYNNYQANNNQWLEIDEKYYEHLSNVLPLIFDDRNSFMSSSPYHHTKSGEATYATCKKDNGKYYAKLSTVSEYREEFHKVKV